MLPDIRKVKSIFPECFIYYKPRDVVSGDFYWFDQIGTKKIAAAVDCTGHGVPGAFMSLIGTSLLNDIIKVKRILDPGEILDQMHEGVKRNLQQNENNNQEGMDMAICIYDTETKVLEFAGANNPVLLVSDQQMNYITGDRMSIGGCLPDERQIYKTNTLILDKLTNCYLYTDGYHDQFGGSQQKKFMSKKFREVLFRGHALSFDEQAKLMDSIYTYWKGRGPQIDDVLVIGLKLD